MMMRVRWQGDSRRLRRRATSHDDRRRRALHRALQVGLQRDRFHPGLDGPVGEGPQSRHRHGQKREGFSDVIVSRAGELDMRLHRDCAAKELEHHSQ
eukprot:4203356-Pyramimonas_sp.AAC.1